VRLSHAGIVRAVVAAAGLTPDEASAAYDRLLDGDLSVVDEVEARLPQLDAPLRLLFEVEGAGRGYLANLRGSLGASLPALAPPLDELAFVVEALEALGVSPVMQAVLARSFEYYSGTVMRFDVHGRTAGAGGRYDGLVGLVGGAAVPASGFALYVSPLSEMVGAPESASDTSVAVVPAGEGADALALAHEAASRLRAAGLRASVGEDGGSGARVVCRDGSPRFEVHTGAGARSVDDVDQVVQALAGENHA
jgi:ATP phosphoribosyltransferase regulatory subunit HisZ